MIEAAIFDVDGTLVDSNDAHIRAWQRAFQAVGKRVAYEDLQEQMGKGADNLVPVFCTPGELRAIGAEVKRLHTAIYLRDYLPDVKPFPRVRELFERVREAGTRIALASSATGPELGHNVKSLRIEGLFEAATSADDVERSKPCPDVFEAALAKLPGVASDCAVAIGDTPYDAVAARRVGMPAIAVLTGGFDAQRLRDAGAIAVCRDVGELLERFDLLSRAGAGRCP